MTLPPLSKIDRLLIVKTSSIGDVIHALPVIQAIKEARPALKIDWVVRARCADVLRGNPYIDHLYVLPNKPSWGDLWSLRREMHSAHYQMSLDMQGLLLSGVITWLSGAPVRLGWDRNREGNALFLTHPIIRGKGQNRHEIDLLYGFAEALGVHANLAGFPPQPYLASDGKELARKWLADLPHPIAALNIGASRAYKRWPTERWTAVASALLQAGRSIVFIGDRSDAVVVAQVKDRIGNPEQLRDISGRTTLRELAAVLADCDLLVSADTGPMHLSVAVGTPVVALFGATDPMRHGPYGTRNTILHKPVPGAMVAGKRPTDEAGAACMNAITVEDVLEAIQTRFVCVNS